MSIIHPVPKMPNHPPMPVMKYGEPTKKLEIRVPLSKYSTIMKMIRKYLKKYEK
jgi:hypothetical protein